MNDLDVPAGMALACRPCGWRPGIDLPMGLVSAHFQTEHGTEDVTLDLVVPCPRCDKPMEFEASINGRDVFGCGPCHRTRTIRRAA